MEDVCADSLTAIEHVGDLFMLPAASADQNKPWDRNSSIGREFTPYIENKKVVLARFNGANQHEIGLSTGLIGITIPTIHNRLATTLRTSFTMKPSWAPSLDYLPDRKGESAIISRLHKRWKRTLTRSRRAN